MKLSDVVARHGFSPSQMGVGIIKDAKLYERSGGNGVTELLCVQKIGNIMKVNRMVVMIAQDQSGQPVVMPVGTPVDKIIKKEELEKYLNVTLSVPQDAEPIFNMNDFAKGFNMDDIGGFAF